MKIVDNLHDLMCKGVKDYKTALENVQDYNLAKILACKCTVPNKSGDIKQAQIFFNILYYLQTDIELYNYIDIMLKDWEAGRLKSGEVDGQRGFNADQKGKTKDSTVRLHASVVLIPLYQAPPGITLHRDNADFMNNFFVNIVTHTFTNIDQEIRERKEANDDEDQAKTLKQLESIKEEWKNTLGKELSTNLDKFDKNIDQFKEAFKTKLGIQSKKGSGSDHSMLKFQETIKDD